MSDIPIKPCPFCGEDDPAFVYLITGHSAYVICDDCGHQYAAVFLEPRHAWVPAPPASAEEKP